MEFKKIYEDNYSDNQQKKFLNRYNNHWKYRIENCFQYIDSLEGKRVLDLGCNIGTFAIESVLRGAKEAIGVDLDSYALKLAHDNARNSRVNNQCFFVACNVSKLGLQSESIDIIMAEDIFEHLLNPILKETLFECKRVLKKNGIVVGHTFPTKYEPLFNNKRFFFKLLIAVFKGNDSRDYILELYNKYFGKAHEASIKDDKHCNPLDHVDFLTLIKKADFKVDTYKTHQLYDFDTKSLIRRLLLKVPESHRHISCVLTK